MNISTVNTTVSERSCRVIDVTWSFDWLCVFETGPLGLAAVFGYSFLVAVVLPTPGELVLAVPIDLGLPSSLTVAIVIGLVASVRPSEASWCSVSAIE